MQIRKATKQDIPAIIDLLKASLGETSSPKTPEYWNWKHLQNPFGPSPVLLAEIDNHLAGIRAFLRWQWQRGDTTYSALRAVDTATHPDYRGRGIFKKLTLRLVDDCRAAGDDFIFNTPNEQSRPGYLKMGWQSLGRVPVRLRVRRPLHVLWRRFRRQAEVATGPEPDYTDYPVAAALDRLAQLAWFPDGVEEGLHTPRTLDYLRWRYQHCPVQDYGAVCADDFLLVFYLRAQALGRELRIVQLEAAPDRRPAALNAAISQLARTYGADYLSIAPTRERTLSSYLSRGRFLPGQAVGPILTFNALQPRAEDLEDMSNWHYQLGDLELF
jgi:GNAT superfamily N-acetyltransferase